MLRKIPLGSAIFVTFLLTSFVKGFVLYPYVNYPTPCDFFKHSSTLSLVFGIPCIVRHLMHSHFFHVSKKFKFPKVILYLGRDWYWEPFKKIPPKWSVAVMHFNVLALWKETRFTQSFRRDSRFTLRLIVKLWIQMFEKLVKIHKWNV